MSSAGVAFFIPASRIVAAAVSRPGGGGNEGEAAFVCRFCMVNVCRRLSHPVVEYIRELLKESSSRMLFWQLGRSTAGPASILTRTVLGRRRLLSDICVVVTNVMAVAPTGLVWWRAVPLVVSAVKTYQGFPHGMPTTQADTINADLLAFVQS